ncbi:MAG: pilin [Pseudomonadota bacterium]
MGSVALTAGASPAIVVTTRNTGAATAPVITLTGTEQTDKSITWVCTSGSADKKYVPASCR